MGTFKDSLKKWFYTNSTSAASSDARVPLLDANGNPKGSDTMDNLASVLGVVPYKVLPPNTNLNDVRSTIVYFSIADNITASVVNAPTTYTRGNILFVCFSLSNNFCVQFVVHYSTVTVSTENTLYMRNISANSIGSWKAVGTGL